MAKPRSNLYQHMEIQVSDTTMAALRKYALEHNITLEDATQAVIRLAIKVIKEEKKRKQN